MMDCDEALAELEAYLDGELPREARSRVESHLSECSPCFSRGEFRRRVREIVHHKCGVAVEMPEGVVTRIRSVIASVEIRRTDSPGP
jgi:mycothiol system anti-sigma-R factor